MIIALCVDDRYGMLFNRRRQSKDRLLRERLLERARGRKLWMNAYSAKQFSPLPENACVREDYLQAAGPEDLCFVEAADCTESLQQCRQLILYCWNRRYPADVYFPAEELDRWMLVGTEDFEGSSHDQITEKIYEKK